MVALTAAKARTNALSFTTCQEGLCLQYSRTWLEIGPRDASAADAWHNAEFKHPGDRNPPNAAPVFWLGGSQGFGHIGLSMNATKGTFRGTDMTSPGQVSTQPLAWVDDNWSSQNYAGWTEDLNGVLIPYLVAQAIDWRTHGLVYVAKLERGTQHSDSVSRLRWRLEHHADIPKAHKPGLGSGYGPDCQEAIRFWQRNVMPAEIGGPLDGSSMSNRQANRLFGDKYVVIEEGA